jgi:hypothetical protein
MIWVLLGIAVAVILTVVLVEIALTKSRKAFTLSNSAIATAEAAFDLLHEHITTNEVWAGTDLVEYQEPLIPFLTDQFCNNCHGPIDSPPLHLEAELPIPGEVMRKLFTFKICERCTSGS